jgi:hypothetical protein
MSGIITIAGKYSKIDPDKEMHLGHQFQKEDGERSMDKRCDYCGRWMTFDCKKYESWGDNVKISFNGWPEKIHCGSLHCQEYHRRVVIHQEKLKKEMAQRHFGLFQRLKKQGVIS